MVKATVLLKYWFAWAHLMKRAKRIFTQDEKELIFNLWKQGTGFSDIGRVLDAAPGTVFTALRETGGIKPWVTIRNIKHLTQAEREEIRVALSAKMSLRAIARMLNRSPSTISREIARNRGRRYYKAWAEVVPRANIWLAKCRILTKQANAGFTWDHL